VKENVATIAQTSEARKRNVPIAILFSSELLERFLILEAFQSETI
jgi:hypothetical protein